MWGWNPIRSRNNGGSIKTIHRFIDRIYGGETKETNKDIISLEEYNEKETVQNQFSNSVFIGSQ